MTGRNQFKPTLSHAVAYQWQENLAPRSALACRANRRTNAESGPSWNSTSTANARGAKRASVVEPTGPFRLSQHFQAPMAHRFFSRITNSHAMCFSRSWGHGDAGKRQAQRNVAHAFGGNPAGTDHSR